MIKRINSTILLLALALFVMPQTQAQEDDTYAMWENIMLTPDNTKLKALSDAMRSHNQKYHASGQYEASVFNIVSGPNAGKLIWSMGPIMYRHLDGRPSEGGHDDDWMNNVMPYVKKMNTVEYWQPFNEEYNNTDILSPDEVTHPIFFVRIMEVKRGQGYSLNTFFKNVGEAVKAMPGSNPWGIYDNQFVQGRDIGRHFAAISFYKDWADFEDDPSFREAYEKVHGSNSWANYINMRDGTFRNWWDEIWVYDKNMSGK